MGNNCGKVTALPPAHEPLHNDVLYFFTVEVPCNQTILKLLLR
jgi:hypothetical protein